MPRDEIKGWVSAHEANKASMKLNYDYDVIFLGDDMVELWNGKLFTMMNANGPRPGVTDEGAQIKQYFNKTFSKEAGGDLDGLALGINGDSVRRQSSVMYFWSFCGLVCLLAVFFFYMDMSHLYSLHFLVFSLTSHSLPICYGGSSMVKCHVICIPKFGGYGLVPMTWRVVDVPKKRLFWVFCARQKKLPFTILIVSLSLWPFCHDHRGPMAV